MKHILTLLAAAVSVRLFLWKHRVLSTPFYQSSWYQLSTLFSITIVLAQSLQQGVRIYQRSGRGPTKHTSSGPTPFDTILHGIQFGWAFLWIQNLLLELLVTPQTLYPPVDIAVLLGINVGLVSVIVPSFLLVRVEDVVPVRTHTRRQHGERSIRCSLLKFQKQPFRNTRQSGTSSSIANTFQSSRE